MAPFWLFMYGAASGVDQALGLGSRAVVLLLVIMALIAASTGWCRCCAPSWPRMAAADALDQWAARAERLMTQFAAATATPAWPRSAADGGPRCGAAPRAC